MMQSTSSWHSMRTVSSRASGQFRGEVQPLFRDVHHLAKGRGLLLRHKTASSDRHAKLVALVRH